MREAVDAPSLPPCRHAQHLGFVATSVRRGGELVRDSSLTAAATRLYASSKANIPFVKVRVGGGAGRRGDAPSDCDATGDGRTTHPLRVMSAGDEGVLLTVVVVA